MSIETQASVAAWANETFGTAGSDLSCATRANLEMAELVHAVATDEPKDKIAGEIADVLIVLYRLCDRLGIDLSSTIVYVGLGFQSEDAATHVYRTNRLFSELVQTLRETSSRWIIGEIGAHLLRAASLLDIDVAAAVDEKMRINRARKWVVSASGHGQHVVE